MARKSKTVLIGGNKPQRRKGTRKNWTKAKEKIFLTTLAETCNVTRACAAAGVGLTSAYRRRKGNAEFRDEWRSAISIGYQQLELELLERAFKGVEKVVRISAREFKTIREYSNQLGVALLRMHRETAAEAEFDPPEEEIEEVRERLIRKLQRIRQRNAGDRGQAQP
jgi:hypothetical protein